MARQVQVKSNQSGGWSVVGSGRNAAGETFHRQRDAQVAARKAVQSRGGGEVVIHSKSGRIAERQTVPPPPADKRGEPKRRSRAGKLTRRIAKS